MQVSPISIIVAVAADFELPPQQSEMFGHLASSQTVCKLRPRRSFLIFLYDELSGIGVFNQDGSRVISFCFPLGPTSAVFNAYASEGSRGGSLPLTKSENAGPVFNLSANAVGRTRGLLEGVPVMGRSGAAVAKVLDGLGETAGGKKTTNGDGDTLPYIQRRLDSERVIVDGL